MTNEELFVILGIIVLIGGYWSIRGAIGMFQRYNAILIILYLVFLFPVAFTHMFLLGMFGKSKKQRIKEEIQQEAEKQVLVEKEKENLKK